MQLHWMISFQLLKQRDSRRHQFMDHRRLNLNTVRWSPVNMALRPHTNWLRKIFTCTCPHRKTKSINQRKCLKNQFQKSIIRSSSLKVTIGGFLIVTEVFKSLYLFKKKIYLAPTPPTPAAPIIPEQPQDEHKTLVYVLVKKPEPQPQIEIPKIKPTEPSKPEVFFIKYKADEKGSPEYEVPRPIYGPPA